jgi:hypothetical protein
MCSGILHIMLQMLSCWFAAAFEKLNNMRGKHSHEVEANP